jgi:hypothetical protein
MTAVPSPTSALGFRAQISGASLWDLVQMECLSRARQVVRVSGEGGVGYLYFAEGRVVHAVTSKLMGETAALEILGWTNGAFQPCERAWPAAFTIESSCEGLILRLAKRRDEGAGNLVAFPARGGASGAGGPAALPAGAADDEFEDIEIVEAHQEGEMRIPNNIDHPPPPAIGRSDIGAEFPVTLRLAPGGAVLTSKGADEELAGVVAYAHRLGQLAGELLGIDPFVAMECTFSEGRMLLFEEENGETVALCPRTESNLQPLRDKLGL